ncbi:hypothetical protein ACA910_017161 [Epithemia clementina (nom. ined.)]
MQLCLSLFLTLIILLIGDALAFSPSVPRSFQRTFVTKGWRLNKKKKGDDDDDVDNDDIGSGAPGMTDAFRKLDSLVEAIGSISDDDNDDAKGSSPKSAISADKDVLPDTKPTETLTPEREVQVYTKAMKDLEATDDDKLYSDVIEEMGGTGRSSLPPVQSTADSDDKSSSSSKTTSLFNEFQTNVPNPDMEKFMDNALAEALQEVKLKSSDSLSSESILNDESIMKEIEAIFDRGSEQLMASLEEIRKEQQSLAQKSAEKSAQEAVDTVSAETERLAKAESAMTNMLERVNMETGQVEKAAADLRSAQAELDNDPIVKLRNGGLAKQAALAGFLLFSFRSIGDTIMALNTDESLMTGALIQGGIALACAAVFFLI